ncbi:syntaxin-11-like isoform 1-T1 [Salvelinus alpinus]|uniref:syntaxin-11 isoform X1 n=1 Tax=Salvelinus sp. IW2-2015 TaxID=2691554 RepID=UPI000CDFF25A|nr:syntaxin-11 isoform X1 [Salvelinus alpinus]
MITCYSGSLHHNRTDPAMRDRLSHMQELSQSNGHVEQMDYAESGESVSGDSINVDLEEELPHQAVVWDNTPELEEVFSQSQQVHREVQLIRLEVKRLREQNSRVLQGTTRMSVVKRDSNAIAADIKARAEGVLTCLKDMDAAVRELEAAHGSNAAVTRIARTQYACLSNSFRDAMFDYNEAEMSHRESCKAHIQRQMEIVGREVTGEEVEEMIETGQWNVFNENILSEGKTARSALNQIESRHRELLDLESRIQSIHEIFLDVALLVEEQGPMMNTIQTNVQTTDVAIQEALVKISKAKRHNKNNPFKKMFCCCFPCVK